MDLTEAKDIKKRWQEYTGELYEKDLKNLKELYSWYRSTKKKIFMTQIIRMV